MLNRQHVAMFASHKQASKTMALMQLRRFKAVMKGCIAIQYQ